MDYDCGLGDVLACPHAFLKPPPMTIAPVPFDPHRFQSAAKHYFARPAYSPRLIARVVDLCSLGARHRVLDLGCGPGMLAIAVAPYVGAVVAVDPEPEMLKIARASAGAVANAITFVEGSSNDLGDQFGRFALVTIGRAFHWMDRVDTLRRLDRIIEPGGAIALFHDSTIKAPENQWHEEFKTITQRYAGGDHATHHGPDWLNHESILLGSAFSMLERISVIERRQLRAASLADRALSFSLTSPSHIGAEKAAALADEVRTFAERAAIDGMLTEVISTEALIARRP